VHTRIRRPFACLVLVLLAANTGIALAGNGSGRGGEAGGRPDHAGERAEDGKAHGAPDGDGEDPVAPPEGPFTEVVSFATKTGFRAVVSYSSEAPVAGVVHYGTSPEMLDQIAPAPGAPDTAQLVILDGLEVGTTYWFQVEDLLTGERSEVHELVAENAFNDLGPNTEQDPTEVSYKPDVYTIDLLVQLDAESLPDDIDPDRSISEIAQGVNVMAERIYDALDGHARIGKVLVTDTNIDHGGTLPGVTVVHAPGTCDAPRNLADVYVTTAMPFDSHTFHYAIQEPCTAIFLGRQGQLVVPWENDLHFGHVAAHEVMHYAFGAPDLYDATGTGATSLGCRNLDWDGSLMHNVGGWAGDRWEMTEVDENPQLTPCAHNNDYEPSTWDEIQSAYTAVPSRTAIEDMFNTKPRSNPDGGALEIHVLDRSPGASTLTSFEPDDSNPEMSDCPAERDTTTTSFTDPVGDATAVLGVDTGAEAAGDPNLDIVQVDAAYLDDGDASTISGDERLRFQVHAADLTEAPATGGTGEWYDVNFSVGDDAYDLVAEWDRTGTPAFRLTRLAATGRETIADVSGTWDVDTDTITVDVPAVIPGVDPASEPLFAIDPGSSARGFEVVSRRQSGVIVPDADTASGGCEVVVPGTAPADEEDPTPLEPADGSVTLGGPAFTFSGPPGTAVNETTLGVEVPVTAEGADTYELDVVDPGRLTVAALAESPELNDIDLYLYDASGAEVMSSADAGGDETLTVDVIPGRYRIVVIRYTTFEGGYGGSASLG
jgi:hypothetical protein